jgi:hypothetical protein
MFAINETYDGTVRCFCFVVNLRYIVYFTSAYNRIGSKTVIDEIMHILTL